jgi:DNA-binding response OmpR family regulator
MNKSLKKILIVEDEVILLEALEKRFSNENYEILTALDGEAGLRTALKKHPDLILLDIIMPKMDGMSMLLKLRQDKWGKTVPVMLLTNLNEAEKVEEAVKAGVSDYLVKSDWHIDEVVAKVRRKLGK